LCNFYYEIHEEIPETKLVFSYTTERRRDDLNKKLKRASGARCNRRHLVAVVYAHIDVHTRVARDAGDVARGDEARVRLVRKRRIVITAVAMSAADSEELLGSFSSKLSMISSIEISD